MSAVEFRQIHRYSYPLVARVIAASYIAGRIADCRTYWQETWRRGDNHWYRPRLGYYGVDA